MARKVLPGDLKHGDVLTKAAAANYDGYTTVLNTINEAGKEAIGLILDDNNGGEAQYWVLRDEVLTVSEAKSA